MSDRITTFSPCRKYRYTLWRDWFDDLFDHGAYAAPMPSYVQFIGLNPSTADEVKNDPTVRRCMDYAKTWGYSALCMTNLFAWRDTDPKRMKSVQHPVGPDNDAWLSKVAKEADLIVAAWGNDGRHLLRGFHVQRMFQAHGLNLHCLKVNTKTCQPAHPLYLRGDLKPIALP